MSDMMAKLFSLQALELDTRRASDQKNTTMEQLRDEIPADVLEHYDRFRLRDRKGVALVQNGVCCECHMGLAIGVLASLMHEGDVEVCGNCGRYLYLSDAGASNAVQMLSGSGPKASRHKRKAVHA